MFNDSSRMWIRVKFDLPNAMKMLQKNFSMFLKFDLVPTLVGHKSRRKMEWVYVKK